MPPLGSDVGAITIYQPPWTIVHGRLFGPILSIFIDSDPRMVIVARQLASMNNSLQEVVRAYRPHGQNAKGRVLQQ